MPWSLQSTTHMEGSDLCRVVSQGDHSNKRTEIEEWAMNVYATNTLLGIRQDPYGL